MLVSILAFSGRAPFLCMSLGSQTIIFSDFDKLVSFLEAQVGSSLNTNCPWLIDINLITILLLHVLYSICLLVLTSNREKERTWRLTFPSSTQRFFRPWYVI